MATVQESRASPKPYEYYSVVPSFFGTSLEKIDPASLGHLNQSPHAHKRKTSKHHTLPERYKETLKAHQDVEQAREAVIDQRHNLAAAEEGLRKKQMEALSFNNTDSHKSENLRLLQMSSQSPSLKSKVIRGYGKQKPIESTEPLNIGGMIQKNYSYKAKPLPPISNEREQTNEVLNSNGSAIHGYKKASVFQSKEPVNIGGMNNQDYNYSAKDQSCNNKDLGQERQYSQDDPIIVSHSSSFNNNSNFEDQTDNNNLERIRLGWNPLVDPDEEYPLKPAHMHRGVCPLTLKKENPDMIPGAVRTVEINKKIPDLDISNYTAKTSTSYFDVGHVGRYNIAPGNSFIGSNKSEMATAYNPVVYLRREPTDERFQRKKDSYSVWAEQKLVREKLKKLWNAPKV